jgi:hypothetical protein
MFIENIRLSNAVEALTEAAERANAEIENYNNGLEAVNRNDGVRFAHFVELPSKLGHIGYASISGHWQLVYRANDLSICSLLTASRKVRLEAVPLLFGFVSELTQEIVSTVDQWKTFTAKHGTELA